MVDEIEAAWNDMVDEREIEEERRVVAGKVMRW